MPGPALPPCAAEPAFEFASEADAADALAGEGSLAGRFADVLAGELAGASASAFADVEDAAAEDESAAEACVDDAGKEGADATACEGSTGFDTRTRGLSLTAGRVDLWDDCVA
jgi:hypothetical protein